MIATVYTKDQRSVATIRLSDKVLEWPGDVWRIEVPLEVDWRTIVDPNTIIAKLVDLTIVRQGSRISFLVADDQVDTVRLLDCRSQEATEEPGCCIMVEQRQTRKLVDYVTSAHESVKGHDAKVAFVSAKGD